MGFSRQEYWSGMPLPYSSLSHSVVFLYFFALIAEEGFLISPCYSLELCIELCRATQYGWVMVESSDKMWSTGEGNGKPLQYSCLENPINGMKRQKDRTLKVEFPRCPICYWRSAEK